MSRLRRLYLTLEIWRIRGRGYLRTLIRAVAIAAVLLGAVNMLAAPFVGGPFFAEYRTLLAAPVSTGEGIVHLADVVLMAVGALIAWFI